MELRIDLAQQALAIDSPLSMVAGATTNGAFWAREPKAVVASRGWQFNRRWVTAAT
jgi:hypothetical protein